METLIRMIIIANNSKLIRMTVSLFPIQVEQQDHQKELCFHIEILLLLLELLMHLMKYDSDKLM